MRLGAYSQEPLSIVDGLNRQSARVRARALGLTVSSLALTLAALHPGNALADGAQQASTAPAPATPATAPAKPPLDKNDIVVNGIRYRDTVLPTRLSSSSTYGLDLNVMDTPRNTTLLSTTQLETLNIEDPRAFSYLTASSYTDSAFGTPNIPRIRGQYADLFINGMRSSFTDNGYGVPPDFDSIENISITKGPASVIDGPGPGVGGEADLLTKRPNLNQFSYGGSASLDTVSDRRINLDVGGPIIQGDLGVRFSYSGEYSGSYFYDHYFDKNALYSAVRWRPNDKYQLDFNTEVADEQYTENVGVNRVSQGLINNEQYLQGVPTGEVNSEVYGGSPIPIGSPGNPFSPVAPYLTVVQLTNPVTLNTRDTIDEAPSTSSRAFKYNAQLIQTYNFNNDLSIENNSFFDYQDSDNQEQYYYADSSKGSWTFESRTDLKDKFKLTFGGLTIDNEVVVGMTYRFAHTNYISDYSAETPGAYDLTSNPALWVNYGAYQGPYADSYTYTSAFGRIQYGTPGRDSVNGGNTGISNLYDGGIFFQDRMSFTDALSVLFGGRLDAVQNHSYDPLGGPSCCYNNLPQSHSTGVYGLGNANVSVVYKLRPWISSYVTLDLTQSSNPNGGEGGINTYGQVPDHELLRADSYLYEAGFKFDLLNKKLFAGTAIFDQKREVPTGPGGTQIDEANIRGVEIELNYQPTRNLFATASYSYIDTTLNSPAGFYNYPAVAGNQYGASNPTLLVPGVALPGNYIDGAGSFAEFAPGQKFQDPGVPQQIFNFLGNYKFESGIGLRYGVQVTSPIETTTSGRLLPTSLFVPQYVVDNNFYYKSPVIPWQYTMNAAIFYQFQKYTVTLSIYNITDQINWQSAPTYYGNDFLVRNDPRTYEIRFQAKF